MSRENFLERLKAWANENELENWVTYGNTKSDTTMVEASYNGRPWYDYITAEHFDGFWYDGTNYNEGGGDADLGDIEWLMEPCPSWWLKEHDVGGQGQSHKFGKPFGNFRWNIGQRNRYDFPMSRLEYWSHMWIPPESRKVEYEGVVGEGYQFYQGMQWSGADSKGWSKKAREFNEKCALHAREFMETIWNHAHGSVPFYKDEKGLKNKRSEWKQFERDFATMIAINQNASQSYSENAWNENDPGDLHLGGGDVYDDPTTYVVVQRLMYDAQARADPFNWDQMTFPEKLLFGEGEGEGAEAAAVSAEYGQRKFIDLILDFLHTDGEHTEIWDGKIPAGTALPTKKKVKYNSKESLTPEGEGWEPFRGRSQSPRGPKETDSQTGILYSPAQGRYPREGERYTGSGAEPSGVAKHVAWLTPGKPGDNWLQFPSGQFRGNMIEEWAAVMRSVWQGGQGGFMGSYAGMKWDEDGTAPARLTDYRTTGYIDWYKAQEYSGGGYSGMQNAQIVFPDAIEDKQNTHSNIKRNAGEAALREAASYFPSKIQFGNSSPEDIPLDKLVYSGKGMSIGKLANQLAAEGPVCTGTTEPVPTDEKQKAAYEALTKSLIKLAGCYPDADSDEDKVPGMKEPLVGLPKEWFKENFPKGKSVVPGDMTQAFTQTIPLTGPEFEGLKAELGGDSVTFHKRGTPWDVMFAPSANSSSQSLSDSQYLHPIPWQEILDAYMTSAYLAVYYYRKSYAAETTTETGTGIVRTRTIFEWYAHRAGQHFRSMWEKVMHENSVANYLTLVAMIFAKNATDGIDEDLANLLAGMVDKGSDDMGKKLASEELPPDANQDEVSEADKEQRERFYKQCALMLNMHTLWGQNYPKGKYHKASQDLGYTSYNGRIHCITNNMGGAGMKNALLNKLICPAPDKMQEFTSIHPSTAAELVPYVRIFKVWNSLDGLKEVEFDFPLVPEARTADQMKKFPEQDEGEAAEMRAKFFDRGDGVGLKEFTWEYDGETPATASKFIKANMTLFFQSFDDFIVTRKNKDGDSFKWVDLFVNPTNMLAREEAGYNTPHHLKYEPEYYRIRVEVGYNPKSVGSSKLGKQLERQNASFFLVLVDNEININDDMTVEIKANYRAYIEEAMDSNKFNALNSPEVNQLRKTQKAMWEKAIKAYKENNNCDDSDLRAVRNSINAQLETLVKKQHKALMTNLLKHERIFYVDFNPKHIQEFRESGVFSRIPEYKNQAFADGPLNKDAAKHLMKLMENTTSKNKEPWEEDMFPHENLRVYYFYLGDLMYLLMSNLYYPESNTPWESGAYGHISDEPNMKKGAERTKLLLFDFDYHNSLHPSKSRQTINIADIPISVDYFFEWYIDTIIKHDVTNIGIGQFLRRILTELITEALAEVCITGEEGQFVSFKMGSATGAGLALNDGKSIMDPIAVMMFEDMQNKDTPPPLPPPPDPSTDMLDELGESPTDFSEGVIGYNQSDNTEDPLGESMQPPEEEFPQSFPDDPEPAPEPVVDPEKTFNQVAASPYRLDVARHFGQNPLLPITRVPDQDNVVYANKQDAPKQMYNYIYVYGDFTDPFHTGTGDEAADTRKGIYHLHLGRDKGLVKTVAFSKNNIPYHRESRMFNQGQAGLLQLSAVYDAEIKMLGNTLFLPGQQVFINPYGFGGELFGMPNERPLYFASPPAGVIQTFNATYDGMYTNRGPNGTGEQTDGHSQAEVTQLSAEIDDMNNTYKPEPGRASIVVNSFSNIMGIGGYNDIIGIKCTVKPGVFETTLSTKFVYSGYPQVKMAAKLAEYRDGKPKSITTADPSDANNSCEAIVTEIEGQGLGKLR